MEGYGVFSIFYITSIFPSVSIFLKLKTLKPPCIQAGKGAGDEDEDEPRYVRDEDDEDDGFVNFL